MTEHSVDIRFAAFIMTHERPEVLQATIQSLLNQSKAPHKILIVDNSSSFETERLIVDINEPNVEYCRMGYNSGPAGAAYQGLQMLASEGYEWIYWGDDDDPPSDPDDLKRLFDVLEIAGGKYSRVGIVGRSAGWFNRSTGRTSSFKNIELKEEIMEGDFVTGNNVSIFNGAMVRSGLLPTKELFFGFEELDYCLKIRSAGYKIVFDAAEFLRARRATGRGHPHYKWRGQSIGKSEKLWRQYYSTRNMFFILAKNNLWTALLINIIRTALKSLYGFRYGHRYGAANFLIQWLAIMHFFKKKDGQTDLSRILTINKLNASR